MVEAATQLGRVIGEKLHDYLLPYQWAWLTDPSDCMIAEKSRRVGWTYVEALRAVVDRMRFKRDYWFSSSDETAGTEFIRYVEFWSDFIGKAARIVGVENGIDHDTGQKVHSRTFPNGACITALSSNPKQFNSKGGDATLDEFSKHEQARRLWDAAQPTTTWGGRLAIFSTHDGEGTLFNELCIEARKVHAGELQPVRDNVPPWSYHHVDIKEAVADGLAEKIDAIRNPSRDVHIPDPQCRAKFLTDCRAKARTQATFDQEYMCIPSGESSVLLTYDMIRSCTLPADELLGKFGTGPLYAGMDVGRVHDLSAFGVAEDVARILMLRKIDVMRNTPYRDQRQAVVDFWSKRPIRRFCGDSTGIGDMLIEDLQHTFSRSKVEKVHFTPEVKEDLAMALVERVQDRRILIPDDADLRADLHAIRKQVTAAGNVRYDAARSDAGHADRFWMLALIVMAAGRNTKFKFQRGAKPAGL